MLSGVCDGVSVVLRTTILQLATPDAMRGRVSSINGLFIGSSNELGAFYAGSMARLRSEEHTSELQSLMRISYAVFCLKKKITQHTHDITYTQPSTLSSIH